MVSMMYVEWLDLWESTKQTGIDLKTTFRYVTAFFIQR